MSVRRKRSVLIVVLALAVASGCRSQSKVEDAGVMKECSERKDCKDGKVCLPEGACGGCNSSGQCRVTETCDVMTERCVFREGWGSECNVNEECSAGQWCHQGLCKSRSEVSLCPSGLSSECPQGQRCKVSTTVCEEDLGCTENGECGTTEVCNTGLHKCVPRCTTETQGTVCAGGEKCVNERCAQCATSTDCSPGFSCDAAGRCSTGSRCYSDRDCKIPLACFPQTGACLPKAPPCASNDNCLSNQRCDVSSGRCIPLVCQPDRYEPNNGLSSAFAVTATTYLDLTLCAADIDYFVINLARGDQLGVNVDADPFSENTFSTVVKDSGGRTLASGKLLVSYVAASAQKYYVAISTSDAYQPYDVNFLMSRGTPCDDDALEPNDFDTQATKVNSSTQLEGAICPQDVDWFSVTVPPTKGLRASLVNYQSGSGLLRLCVFSGTTQLSCNDDASPQVSVAAEGTSERTLLVKVVGSTERVANGYTLKLELP